MNDACELAYVAFQRAGVATSSSLPEIEKFEFKFGMMWNNLDESASFLFSLVLIFFILSFSS
jgi:hypothetical protein